MTWDLELFRTINGWSGRVPLADAAMVALGHGSNLVLPGILVFAYWWWRARREAVIGAAALAALVAVADVLGAQVKHLVARPRPCRILDGVRELVGCGGTYSFPSNHAMNTAAAAAFAQVLYPATGWVSWPLVVLIGLSRVYVGAHFVTDVVGGWLMGALAGGVAAWALRRWWRAPRGTRLTARGAPR